MHTELFGTMCTDLLYWRDVRQIGEELGKSGVDSLEYDVSISLNQFFLIAKEHGYYYTTYTVK